MPILTGTPTNTTIAPVYNVKSGYGAKGDYSGSTGTDDTAAIQAAITAAGAAGGAIVYFPEGRYYVRELTLSGNGVTLQGCGIGDTASGGFGSMLVGSASLVNDLLTVSGTKCSVRQMTLSGNGHGRDVIRLVNTANRFVGDSLYIQSAGTGNGITHGTSVTSVTNKWSNVFVANNTAGYGILVNSSDTEWSNVTTFQNGIDGMKLVGTAANIVNLHTWGNTGAGLNLSGAGCRVSNIYSETNTGNGIDILSASGVYNSIGTGLVKANAIGVNVNTSAARTSLSNLKVMNNTAQGIFIQSGNNCQLDTVNCFDDQGSKTQTWGIQIAAGVTGTTLSNVVSNIADNLTGGLLDAGTATERNGTILIRKSADQSVTNSVGLVNDNDFQVTMAAGEVWQIEGTMFCEGATTGDLAVRLTPPSTGSGFWFLFGPNTAAASAGAASYVALGQLFNTTQTVGMLGAATIIQVGVRGLVTVGASGGTFVLKWAQGTADATATIIHAASYLTFRRIS